MSKESKGELRAKRRARRQRQQAQRAEQRVAAQEAVGRVAAAERLEAEAGARAARLEGSLASALELAEARLLRAATAERQATSLVAANVALEQQLREAEGMAADRGELIFKLTQDRDRLAATVARYQADDRDLGKLRRRLRERDEELEQARRERDQARARVPPEPLRYERAAPAASKSKEGEV